MVFTYKWDEDKENEYLRKGVCLKHLQEECLETKVKEAWEDRRQEYPREPQ